MFAAYVNCHSCRMQDTEVPVRSQPAEGISAQGLLDWSTSIHIEGRKLHAQKCPACDGRHLTVRFQLVMPKVTEADVTGKPDDPVPGAKERADEGMKVKTKEDLDAVIAKARGK